MGVRDGRTDHVLGHVQTRGEGPSRSDGRCCFDPDSDLPDVCLQDWHLGGKCDVFLWGAGRHGQLAEAGRNILVPTTAPSFSQAQQARKQPHTVRESSGPLSCYVPNDSSSAAGRLWTELHLCDPA